MLRSGPQSPWARAALVVFSIAVVGAVIGVGAEEVSFRRAAVQDEEIYARPVDARRGPSAAEKAQVQRAVEGLPPYKDAVPEPLAVDFLGPKAPIAAAWFRTDDAPDTVLEFYRGAFLDAGIPTVGDRTGPSSGYVGYVNPRTGETHLVTVVAEGGKTMVFPSVGSVEGLASDGATFPEGMPHPEGASKPMVLTFRHEGRVEVSVVSKVVSAAGGQSVRELVAFYRKALPAQGWSLDAVQEEQDEATLEASRGGSRITTLLRRRSPEEVDLYVRLVGPA